jgi:UDP-sulfoquinovose synthase
MRIAVIGGDGYCGWPSALYLSALGHDVVIIDNFIRREWDRKLCIASLTPIRTLAERLEAWQSLDHRPIAYTPCDVTNYHALRNVFQEFLPDTIVHFGQQRSAPFSMMDRDAAALTLTNNTIGNLNILWIIHEVLPEAHLIKLGTMGEYGTPNIEIEEGFITIEHKGRSDRLPFPKQPGSFYHLTKVSDSDQIYFACRTWGIRATDLNQGVVYGLSTEQTVADEMLVNRLDYDGIFGTVLNRFCIQAALGFPLTVYGRGSQTRTFINILDTVRCIALAVTSPPALGEYRVVNQFTEIFSVMELAHRVRDVADTLGIRASISEISNPRVEREGHYYSSINEQLHTLGLRPHYLSEAVITELISTAQKYADRVDRNHILPTVKWNDHRDEPSIIATQPVPM